MQEDETRKLIIKVDSLQKIVDFGRDTPVDKYRKALFEALMRQRLAEYSLESQQGQQSALCQKLSNVQRLLSQKCDELEQVNSKRTLIESEILSKASLIRSLQQQALQDRTTIERLQEGALAYQDNLSQQEMYRQIKTVRMAALEMEEALNTRLKEAVAQSDNQKRIFGQELMDGQRQILGVKGELMAMSSCLQELQNQTITFKEESRQRQRGLTNKCDQIQKQMGQFELEKAGQASLVSDLTDQSSKLKQKIIDQSATIDGLLQQLNLFKEASEDKQRALVQLTVHESQSAKKLQLLERANKLLEGRVTDCTQQVAHLSQENVKLTQQNRANLKESRTNLKTVQSLKQRLEDLESALQESQRKITSLDKLAKQRKKEVDESNNRLAQKQQQLEGLIQLNRDSEGKSSIAGSRIATLELQQKQSQREVCQLTQALVLLKTRKREEIESLILQKDKLQQQNGSLMQLVEFRQRYMQTQSSIGKVTGNIGRAIDKIRQEQRVVGATTNLPWKTYDNLNSYN